MDKIWRKNIETSIVGPHASIYNYEYVGNLIKNNLLEESVSFILDNDKVKAIVDNSYLLNRKFLLGQVFEAKFKDTLNFIYRNQTKLLLHALDGLEQEVWITIEKLYNEEFRYFFPNGKQVQEYINNKKRGKKLWLFSDEFYNFDLPDEEKFIKSLYFLIAVYYLSYFVWLEKIKKNLPKYFKKEKIDVTSFHNFSSNLRNKLGDNLLPYEEDALISLGWILKSYISDDIAFVLIDHLVGARKKTLYSAILKLLKSDKYVSQFGKEGILGDQLGFKVVFGYGEKKDLEKIAKYFKSQEKKGIVNKFNDRGVLNTKHDNKDTLKGIFPFVNVGFFDENNNLPLGELSLRYFSKNEIYDLVLESKTYNELISKLIIRIDDLNHQIYKDSQQIKILRKLFVDKKVLPKKRNLEKSASTFLSEREEISITQIEEQIRNFFDKIGLSFVVDGVNIRLLIQKQYWEILKQKVEQVIRDLAWESIIKDIKATNSYKNLKDEEKRVWLKRLGKYFENSLIKGRKKIGKYSQEIKQIYTHKYLKNYNEIIETAIFYGEIIARLEKIKMRFTPEENIPISVKVGVGSFKSNNNQGS